MRLLLLLSLLVSLCQCQDTGSMSTGATVAMVLFFVLLGGGAVICIFCCRNDGSWKGECTCNDSDDEDGNHGKTTCYLCQQKVDISDWNSGNHRSKCTGRHK